jgi:hypothetical protein
MSSSEKIDLYRDFATGVYQYKAQTPPLHTVYTVYLFSGGVRRSSARASILDQRRNSVVSDTQESPEKIREADNMNKRFRIGFEDGDLQQEELTCSSCLSTHCDMEQPLCLFCGWKVLE